MEYNAALQENLILYICFNAPRKKLGTVKLNKILWFFDKFVYGKTGHTVTGEMYIKKPRGPVAKHFYEACKALEGLGKLRIRRVGHKPKAEQFEPVEYVCKHPVDKPGVDEWQLGVLDYLIDKICNEHTSRTISELSHDAAWSAVPMNEQMSFLSYHVKVGRPTAETVAWARECAEKFYAEQPQGIES